MNRGSEMTRVFRGLTNGYNIHNAFRQRSKKVFIDSGGKLLSILITEHSVRWEWLDDEWILGGATVRVGTHFWNGNWPRVDYLLNNPSGCYFKKNDTNHKWYFMCKFTRSLNHLRENSHPVANMGEVKVLLWLKKNHFLFFFRFWKCDCLTLDWQKFDLWFLSKGCLLWISRSANTHVVSFAAVFQALRDLPKNSRERNSIQVFDTVFNLMLNLIC